MSKQSSELSSADLIVVGKLLQTLAEASDEGRVGVLAMVCRTYFDFLSKTDLRPEFYRLMKLYGYEGKSYE